MPNSSFAPIPIFSIAFLTSSGAAGKLSHSPARVPSLFFPRFVIKA
jgi:hypothetical protein